MKLLEKIDKIQREIGVLKKKKTNPFFKSKYLDLTAINENLDPLLEKHKVNITQPVTNVDGRPALALVISDLESDEFIREVAAMVDLPDAQKMGGCVTYFRRYSLVSYFRIDAEDDDGNFASSKSANEQPMKVKSYERAADRNKREEGDAKDKANGIAPF